LAVMPATFSQDTAAPRKAGEGRGSGKRRGAAF
jgi:hypothetical protein